MIYLETRIGVCKNKDAYIVELKTADGVYISADKLDIFRQELIALFNKYKIGSSSDLSLIPHDVKPKSCDGTRRGQAMKN